MFCDQLKTIRKASEKTQKDLADYLKISTQSISKWEKGDALPSLEFLPRIAKFFGCSVNAFFTEIEKNTDLILNNTNSTKEALDLEEKLNGAFKHFHLNAKVIKIHEGVRIYSFIVAMLEGCGLSDIKKRADDILYQIHEDKAILNTKDYKDNTFAIEIPKKSFNGIPLDAALSSSEYLNSDYKIPLIIGYDVHDNLIIDDLTRMPHLLLGGTAGSGKSAFLRNLITCMTSRLSPKQLQLIICDFRKFKVIDEERYPHIIGNMIGTIDDAIERMKNLVDIMNERTALFATAGVRNLDDFNQQAKSQLPRLVLIIDELADFIMRFSETEDLIMKLTLNGRATGIHLIIASRISSPFTPIIKANIPSRASLKVSEQSDSRVILEEAGAELLSIHGDMIYRSAFIPPVRLQAPYITKEASLDVSKNKRGKKNESYSPC